MAVNGVTAGGGLAFLSFPSLFWPQFGTFRLSAAKAGLSLTAHQLGIAASNWCQADADLFYEQNVSG